jgi:photosystem II stability/assembly factor-like uncharacterized protein
LKTTDGGGNWTLLDRPTEYHIRTVQFFDALIGYIAGGDHRTAQCDYPPLCPSYSHGTIMKTIDGGTTWQILYRDTLSIRDVFFLTPSLGWATCIQLWDEELSPRGASYILKTTDGGQTWDLYPQPFGLGAILFANETHGWAIGSNVARTTDGGKTWLFSSPLQRNAYLNSLYFTDALHGYSVGFGGVILQTNDGGLTWQHYDSWLDIGSNNIDVHFINPDTGWIVSSGRVYRTTDKGEHWEAQDATGDAIDCTTDGNCWAIGYGGNIFHTSDAGNTWTMQISGTDAFLKDVKFFNSTVGWAVGEGAILKTMNGGKPWVTQNVSPPISGYNQIVIQDSLRVWVYGSHAERQTKDGGQTWTEPDSIRPVFFLNPDTGWARGHRTFDGGKTWVAIGPVGADSRFVNANTGWNNNSYSILKTLDGGSTWKTELKVDVYHALTLSLFGDGIYFVDSLHGWAVGRGGTLLRYGYPELTTSVPNDEVSESKLEGFELYQNYPNPFNPNTRISFSIHKNAHTSLKIYDILGRRVVTLVDETKNPGQYEIEWNAQRLPSGMYFYRLTVGGFTQTRKMVILR